MKTTMMMNTLVSRMLASGVLAAAAAAIAMPAAADGIHVEITGSVDYNVIHGDLTGIPSGAPVVMSFNLDSNNYLNSSTFPTRAYAIDIASFDLNFGGVHITMDNPQPGGDPAYFVLRNNDPAVDGFFFSHGPDYDTGLTVHIPGVATAHEVEFKRTFDTDTTLHSLNILDAVGHYGFENMSSYLWTLGVGAPGAEVVYESITISAISAVPEPATLSLFGAGALLLAGRARKKAKA